MKDDTVLLKRRKRRFGDRYDGYRVRKLDMHQMIVPNIMRTRCDSQIFFEEPINIGELERYIRKKRAEDLPNLRLVHVIMAAIVRLFAQKPRLNRFIAGKKVYSHNNMRISMTIKRSMSADGQDTEILPYFEPTDSIYDVVRRFDEALYATRSKEDNTGDNETDAIQRVLCFTPTWVKSLVVNTIRHLDGHGLMPKVIYRGSPFHSSAYLTDIGSLGIDSVYHHLYEFGTTSCFVAIGKKQTVPYVRNDGTIGQRRIINFRFVLDERVCDGFYYANAMKTFKSIIKHPEVLDTPLTELPDDM